MTDVAGGSTKPLNLISQIELSEGAYPVEIDFYTTFGNTTSSALLTAGVPDNPSGVKINIIGQGYPLQSGGHIRSHPLDVSNGDPVSGKFYFHYSSDAAIGDDADLGLPYKIYLDHVEGDHSKKYAFLTGIELSGSGLNYDVSSTYKSVRFRTGQLGTGPGMEDSLTMEVKEFGDPVSEEGSGLVSESTSYSTMITEAHMSSIRTNLYTGDIDVGSEDMSVNIGKTEDGHLITRLSLIHI